jgi:multiple sugar transport system permease protein
MAQIVVERERPSVTRKSPDGVSSINLVAYCLVLPAILWRAAYTFAPMVETVWLSFTNKGLTNRGRFVGLANYFALWQDDTLVSSLTFTVVYTVVSVALETALGLLAALLLMHTLRGKAISNFIMMLPWVVAPLLAATIWKIMFYEDGGILNDLLRRAGIITEPVPWLSNAGVAQVSVIIVTVWKNVSWVTLIFMAGLGSLPTDIYEAAAVDGASMWQRFWRITLPLLRPTIFLILMFRGMGEVQTFEQINGLARGGPGTATTTLAVYAYERFFQEFRYGSGSAINVLLLVFTVVIGGFFAWRLYRIAR